MTKTKKQNSRQEATKKRYTTKHKPHVNTLKQKKNTQFVEFDVVNIAGNIDKLARHK